MSLNFKRKRIKDYLSYVNILYVVQNISKYKFIKYFSIIVLISLINFKLYGFFGNNSAVTVHKNGKYSGGEKQICANVNVNTSAHVAIQCSENGLSTTIITGQRTEEKPNFERIKVLNVKSTTENREMVIGGITSITEDNSIYVASLHLFLNDISNWGEISSSLNGKKPILVSYIADIDSRKYFDIVLFVNEELLKSNEETPSSFEYLREKIKNILKLNKSDLLNVSSNMDWVSPNQLSKIGDDPASAFSSGKISVVVRKDNERFTEFYLNKDYHNFSTAGSSGSVIFGLESSKLIPLGVLQCQMKNNLTDTNGVTQNTYDLYKILGFDLLLSYDFNLLENFDQFSNLVGFSKFISSESIEIHPDCKPRDGKDGGDF